MISKQTSTDIAIATWVASNPADADPATYPKLMYNVNLPPVLVGSADDEASMGSAWRTINISVPDVPPVSIEPADANVPAAGGSGTFHVSITGIGVTDTWIAEKDAAATWLTIAPTTAQSADGDVTYTAEPNLETPRSANVYVNGKTFTVNQAGV